MNHSQIINELTRWQPDELLFRDAFHMQHGLLSREEFLQVHADDPVNLEYALHPESMGSSLQEDGFIRDGRNTAIIKHPRYLPLFFHEHGFFELIYVLSGEYSQYFTDRTVHLTAGDLCLLAPGVKHGIQVNDDSIILNILIRQSTFLDIFMNTIRDKTQISRFFLDNLYARKQLRYLLFHTGADTLIRDYILDMYQEQTQDDEYSDRIICSLLTIFFTQLMRRHRDTLEIPEMERRRGEEENEMVTYIMDHFQHITIQELADHFHYSRQYCSKRIKDATGHTFSELLTGIRIQQGMLLLTGTSLSIARISDRLGYENPETFIRAFKASQGLTPGQYRKQAGGSAAEAGPATVDDRSND